MVPLESTKCCACHANHSGTAAATHEHQGLPRKSQRHSGGDNWLVAIGWWKFVETWCRERCARRVEDCGETDRICTANWKGRAVASNSPCTLLGEHAGNQLAEGVSGSGGDPVVW